ncbi:quinone oxidoreductase [Niveibacterium sp. SC-1]|uniref:quinone oxidoreductase family protein n=1 Tax=Niveibacterium sp. SC-1 TaxID=3135646 RepID=UPI00311D66F8
MNDEARVIRITQAGGPEVLALQTVSLPAPGPGEVRIRQEAVGLNFIDIYHRSGLYPVELPSPIGLEAAGVVEALGPGVADFSVGDRVAYAGGPLGAYASARNYPAERLVRLPDAISTESAAAMMLAGMTAWFLLRRTYPVKAGDTILVHAAAGGVGSILSQWGRALGATVIGTVGSEAKRARAEENGCAHVIVLERERFPERVREITGGRGLPVVYDGIGRDTFNDSLACLAPLGLMVSFGNASGPVPPFDIGTLARMGSLFLTRPTMFAYVAARADLLVASSELFGQVQSGAVKIGVGQRYALADAAQAQRDLAERRTSGSTVLLP